MKKNLLFLSLLSLFFFSAASGRADDSLIKIQTLPDQTSVKAGMMFLVHAQVANTSPDTSIEFWANNCSYEKHWVTDNPGVFLQSWTCDENTLEQITLQPGDVYEKNLILYIPQNDHKDEPVVFRLGFKRMSENGDVAEPLWGDPVTMRVIVPEEVKDAVSAAEANAKSVVQEPGTSSDSVDAGQVSPPVEAGSQVPEVTLSQVFQDPGVPIQARTGAVFSIALVSNPSTGFRWKMTLPENDKTVTFLGSEYVASREGMPGAPGTEVFKFRAATPGEMKVVFVYERPWETITAPTRKIFSVLVQET